MIAAGDADRGVEAEATRRLPGEHVVDGRPSRRPRRRKSFSVRRRSVCWRRWMSLEPRSLAGWNRMEPLSSSAKSPSRMTPSSRNRGGGSWTGVTARRRLRPCGGNGESQEEYRGWRGISASRSDTHPHTIAPPPKNPASDGLLPIVRSRSIETLISDRLRMSGTAAADGSRWRSMPAGCQLREGWSLDGCPPPSHRALHLGRRQVWTREAGCSRK